METPIRCLIIEDSPDDADLLARQLERAGLPTLTWRVETLEDAQMALSTEPWDVVLADYSLPRFRGLEVLNYMNDQGIDTPFIIVSGTIDVDTALSAMKAGARDFILKDELVRLPGAVQRELAAAQVRAARLESARLADAINDVNTVLLANVELDKAMEDVARLAAKAVRAETAVLLLKEGPDLVVHAQFGITADIIGERFLPDSLAVPATAEGSVSTIDDVAALSEPPSALVRRTGCRAAMFAPLVARDSLVGGLGIGFTTKPHQFHPAETDFARKLSASVSAAVVNAQLFSRLRAERDVLLGVMEKADSLLGYVDADLRFAAANEALADVLGLTSDQIVGRYADEFLIPLLGQDVLSEVLASGEDSRVSSMPAAGTKGPTDYWDWTISRTGPAGGSGGLVVSGARVTEKVRESRLAASMAHIGELLSSSLDTRDWFTEALATAAAAINARGMALLRCEDATWTVVMAWGSAGRHRGIRLRESTASAIEALVSHSVDSGPIAVNDPDAFIACTNAVVVPVRIGMGQLAALMICLPENHSLAEDEEEFLQRVAFSLAAAEANSRLYERERGIAETLQQSLLALPEHQPGLSYAHFYGSATEHARVGGDFYDLFEVPNGNIALVIGDVSGKGIDAASTTALVKNIVRAHVSDEEPPASALAKTNDAVHRFTPPEMFVTLFLALYDPRTGSIEYSAAGHPAPVLSTSDGEVTWLAEGGPLLGAIGTVSYPQGTARLRPGDVLFMYTDGVVEARRDGELFGEDRLRDVIVSAPTKLPEPLVKRVVDTVREYSYGSLSDDVAILAVTPSA